MTQRSNKHQKRLAYRQQLLANAHIGKQQNTFGNVISDEFKYTNVSSTSNS